MERPSANSSSPFEKICAVTCTVGDVQKVTFRLYANGNITLQLTLLVLIRCSLTQLRYLLRTLAQLHMGAHATRLDTYSSISTREQTFPYQLN